MDSQSDAPSSVISQGTLDAICCEVLPGGQKVGEFLQETPSYSDQDIKMETEDPLGEGAELDATHAFPSPTGRLPSTQEFLGDYGFNFSLDPTGKPNWVYSEDLDYLFIDMNKVLMLEFRLGGPRAPKGGLRVRALPTYSSVDFAHDPVDRCVMHALEDDPCSQAHSVNDECRCPEFGLSGHVLRCDAPSSIYHHDRESGRHSVSVPVPPSASSFQAPFRFACKTSCPKGMMRRHLRVIFTLEDLDTGQVVGRQVLPVKVCSCPKRDKERMERDEWDAAEGAVERAKGRRKRVAGPCPPLATAPSPAKARRARRSSSSANAEKHNDTASSEGELRKQRLKWVSNMKASILDLMESLEDFNVEFN